MAQSAELDKGLLAGWAASCLPVMSDSSKTHTPQSSKGSQNEQIFTILPHPAVSHVHDVSICVTNLLLQNSNNPADLTTSPGAGFANLNPGILAHHAHGPHVPSQETLNKLDAPLVSARCAFVQDRT